ncbi:probable 26S proteasome regulatory subunit p27 [Monosporozyma unispora]
MTVQQAEQNTTSNIGEVNELLTNLELNSSIVSQVAKLKELDLKEVTELKQRVEEELTKFANYLESQDVDMNTNLVTEDGYPREDIDVLQIRLVRRNINMLRNDLNKVMEYSYTLLSSHFDNLNQPKLNTTSQSSATRVEYKIPFAVINEIDINGPVFSAGVQNYDKLVSLGHIHAGNHMKLKSLQNEVIQNENQKLNLRVLRKDEEIIDLELIPTRNWNGRGLLGCRLQEL